MHDMVKPDRYRSQAKVRSNPQGTWVVKHQNGQYLAQRGHWFPWTQDPLISLRFTSEGDAQEICNYLYQELSTLGGIPVYGSSIQDRKALISMINPFDLQT